MEVKQRRLNGWRRLFLGRFLLLVALILGLAGILVLQSTAHAQSERGRTGTIAGTPAQVSGELNIRWWQWMFSVRSSENPALAPDGPVNCSVGQSGDVWFLAGQLNRGSAQHSCTIPPGKTLAIPLSNVWRDNVCENPQLSQDDLKAFVEATASSASKLKASIDGKNIPGINTHNNRAGPAGPFSYTIPSSATDNVLSTLLSAAYGKVVPIPGKCPNGAPDVTSRTINGAWADGYYFTVPPLPPLPGGKAHTINFGGTMLYGGPGGAPVTQNITYDITVS